MFLQFFGRDRDPSTLSQRDWDRFIRERRAGRIGISGRPVSNRTIAWDLTFLMAVLNWAARSRDEEGKTPSRVQPAEGPQGAEGAEPDPRGPPRKRSTRRCSGCRRRLIWRFRVALVITHYPPRR